MQLAMFVYYNWDLTKKKRIRNIMISLQLSGNTPPDGGLHPKLANVVNRRGTSAGNAQKGDSLGDSPGPQQDLVPHTKVAIGSLSSPVSG
jgi:hypothetical protein